MNSSGIFKAVDGIFEASFGIFEASLLLTSTKKYIRVIMIYYLLSANNLLVLMEFLKLLIL